MARNGKFSFPLPGRRSRKKLETEDDDARSTPSTPTAHEWPSRNEEPTSKAHRVLGTSEPMFRTTSKQSVPPSPGFMSITVSEATDDDRASGTTIDQNGYQRRPIASRRASSNVMGRMYSDNERRGSVQSTASRQIHPQTSNSTLRSHYDKMSSPLSISQQTSDSAVRDMALRRGHPQVVTEYNCNGYAASPVSPIILDEARRKEYRKSKPTRLDLSKLFPKPKGGAEGQALSNALLSPSKYMNSPSALSMTSDYYQQQFPRPMTREPTPNPRTPAKLKKAAPQAQAQPQPGPQLRPQSVPHTPSSPERKFKRDQYDNAKVHVRRPPKGVQHWFDALDEDSDEASEHASAPIHAPKAIRPNATVPSRMSSHSRLVPEATIPKGSRSQHLSPPGRKDTFSHEDLIDVRMDSPSQVSMQSTRTRDSALAKINLQNSSVLSFSSSEDEDDENSTKADRVPVRRSLVINDDAGDIVIGQAHAFEMRPHRRPSAMSARSTSTNAATIEVMYTPEPPISPFHFPRHSNYSGSRQSSHARQPSVVMEEEVVVRPKTAVSRPLSPAARSVRSVRSSASEPKPQLDSSQRLMEVTAEEMALLELMRKKRAAMGMTRPESTMEERPQKTPPEIAQHRYRTSGFLAEASPVRVVDAQTVRKSSAKAPSPLPRGRALKAHYDASVGLGHLRDSSTSDAWSDHHDSPAGGLTIPHHIPTPSEFSPLDPFPPPSPVLTASVATTEHASPLPSPITPGLRSFEEDINVKVASSETSSNESAEVSFVETGTIDAPSESIKSSTSHDMSTHRRRRTASSGANVTFPAPPTHGLTDLTPVSEASSGPPSIIEPPVPKLVQKNSKRTSGVALVTNAMSRSRQSSLNSQSSYASLGLEKKGSKRVSRQSSATSMRSASKAKRSSVGDDVLAAWNSLGGTY